MKATTTRLALLVLLSGLLPACKIQISVPQGGSVVSASGTRNCASGMVCRVNVASFDFSDSFTAVPAPGYTFTGWARGQGHFCQGETGACRIDPGPVAKLQTSEDPNHRKLYEGIRDALNNPAAIFYLVPVFTPVERGTATLSWTVPTTRANGTPLPIAELGGYEIYITGETSGVSTSVSVADPLATSHQLTGLEPDTWHFAISAIDSNGIAGEMSPVVSKTVD